MQLKLSEGTPVQYRNYRHHTNRQTHWTPLTTFSAANQLVVRYVKYADVVFYLGVWAQLSSAEDRWSLWNLRSHLMPEGPDMALFDTEF